MWPPCNSYLTTNASLGICILDAYQQEALNRASLHLG